MRRLSARDTRALVLVAVTALGCVVFWSWSQWRAARSEAARAADRHAAALQQARRLVDLRSGRAAVDDRPRPQPDLVARLHAQMQSVGMAPQALSNVSSTAAQPIASTPYRRQTTTFTIDGAAPADVARLLAAWREAEPLWVVRSVRLQHAPQGQRKEPGRGGEQERYSATIVLENIHLASLQGEGAGEGKSRS